MSDRNSPTPGGQPPRQSSGRRASFNTNSGVRQTSGGSGSGTPGGQPPLSALSGLRDASFTMGGSQVGSAVGTQLSVGGAMSARPRRSSLMSALGSQMSERAGGPMSARTAPKVALHAVNVEGDDGGIEMISASDRLALATELRKKYKSIDQGQKETKANLPSIPKWNVDYGVYHFASQTTLNIPTWEEYYSDVTTMLSMSENGQCRAACKYRLAILEEKYNLYRILNTDIEEGVDKKRRGGGVLANCIKVDSGIRMTTSMTAMDLLDSIQTTYKDQSALEVDVFNAGDEMKSEPVKLRMLFHAAEVESEESLTVEGLGLQPSPHTVTPSNADVFDPAINKAGRYTADLMRAFLSRDTLNNGDFFANAVKTPLIRREKSSTQASETHIEVLGRSSDEWYDLARWMDDKGFIYDYPKNMWIIEFPRVKANRADNAGVFKNFEFHQAHLDNLFRPLFEASLLPDDKKNAKLSDLLTKVGAFIIRSDEETREEEFKPSALPPGELRWSLNPSDLYFAYYVWANICSLNALRSRQKSPHNNTFQLRSVAGERSTQLDSLVYGFLLCDHINQGLLLAEQPVLQYLYGANKIGVTMSPLSNNGGRAPYAENPLPVFFRRGLNVSLTTENPLLFHHSQDVLNEEYSTAATLFRLSPIDVTELARSSVVNSTFPVKKKREWLGIPTGANYSDLTLYNSQEHTCVPTCRLEFRDSLWASERAVIEQAQRRHGRGMTQLHRATPPPMNMAVIVGGGLDDGTSSVATTALVTQSPHSPNQGSPGRSGQGQPKKDQLPLIMDPNVKFTRVSVCDGPLQRDKGETRCAEEILSALQKRSDFHPDMNRIKVDPKFREEACTFTLLSGVYCIHEKARVPRDSKTIPIYDVFKAQMESLREIIDNTPLRAFAQRRLLLLEHRYKLHVAVNHSSEAGSTEDRASQNRDFYQATKVDTNVRSETGMTARQLLAFIIAKSNNNGDDIVSQQQGKAPQTLRQLLDALNITPSSLTVDDLNVQVDATQEVSSMQWTPEAKDRLLGLLLKTDNDMRGRYFAEITKLTFEQFKRDNFTFVEYRLPIYGASYNEWGMLASWFDTHGMACYNNRWMVQIPRIYSYLRQKGKVANFADYLKNVFDPLWEVSLRPTKKPWAPRLFHFLNHVSGFDCVEDEAKVDSPVPDTPPQMWTEAVEPPYSYYIYYIWANIQTLNEFRKSRGYSTFHFRPSCGESGGKDHLMAGFLLADGINYGVTLRLDPVLQYLAYLAQLGISVSPLSNNTNLLDYLDNPFPKYFRRGLNVSLSTDGPLRYHHTQEPLIEEYSIASKVWKLSPNDMCEIARNSVRQSGFPDDFKTKVSGEHHSLSSSKGNDAAKTHLSDIRVAYRYETYHSELQALEHLSGSVFPKSMHTLAEEEDILQEMSEKNKLGGKHKEGIIVAHHDDVDVQKLTQQQTLAVSQLNEVHAKIEALKRQNKQLSETYADVLAKEIAAKHQRQGTSPVDDEGPEAFDLADGAAHSGYLNINPQVAQQEVLPVVESDGCESETSSESGSGRSETEGQVPATADGGADPSAAPLPDVLSPMILEQSSSIPRRTPNTAMLASDEDMWTPNTSGVRGEQTKAFMFSTSNVNPLGGTTGSNSGSKSISAQLLADTNDEVEKLVSGIGGPSAPTAGGGSQSDRTGGLQWSLSGGASANHLGPPGGAPQRTVKRSTNEARQQTQLSYQRMLAGSQYVPSMDGSGSKK